MEAGADVMSFESFEDARRLLQATGTLEAEDGARLMFHLGLVKRAQGDFEEWITRAESDSW